MRSRRTTVLAGALAAWALLCVLSTVVLGPLSGRGWSWLSYNFVVTNTLIGAALVVAGWPIAHHRPRNPVGWLLLVGGCGYVTSGGGLAALAFAADRGWGGWPWRLLATFVNVGFAFPVCLCLPLAVLLFPDGRFPSRRARLLTVPPVIGLLSWVLGAWFYTRWGLSNAAGFTDLVPGEWARAVVVVAGPAITFSYLSGLVMLGWRYRRGTEQVRQQILWVLLAVGVLLVGVVVSEFIPGDDLAGVLPLVLIPFAMTVAVLRHHLLDIRLVVSRSLLYAVLTASVVASYSALVVMIDWLFRRSVPGSPVVAALAIAFAFNPVRMVLQRWTDRLLYGARRDPVRALTEVGRQLGDPGTTGLDGVVEALCRVLRFPAAAVVSGTRTMASYGDLPQARHVVPLRQGSEEVGELLIGLRSGETRVGVADEKVLELLATPVAVAVRADQLAHEVQESRERVISTREEERRRLRRDLHDGLGPVLTGVVLQADAARHLLDTDPRRAAELLGRLSEQSTAAVDEIRRLVEGLRPPALDELGLATALDEYARGMVRRQDGGALAVDVDTRRLGAELPAAVEVAAYRIVTEALTNVARHSSASRATVRLQSVNGQVHVEIRDDGVADPDWQQGVGLASIQERAAELRGTSEIRLGASGGLVRVVLPLLGSAS